MTKPYEGAEPAFGQVSRELESKHDEHEAFWWSKFGPPLATLLSTAKYSEESQLSYLRWFHRWIPRSLGPRPVDGKPRYRSTMTLDGSPLEYSLNWKEKKTGQLIRFTAEPTSHETGIPVDAINRAAARNLLTSMATEVPGIDLGLYDALQAATRVPDDKVEDVQARIPAGALEMRVVLAYDLEDTSLVAKAYFNPEPRALHDGTTPTEVAFAAARACDGPHGSYAAPVEAVRAHLRTHDHVPGGPHVFLMAIDCVAPSPKSRVKLYNLAPVRTLAAALDMFNLGGRLTGPVIEGGLEAVRSFWCHRFGFDRAALTPEQTNEEVLPAESRCLFVYEMRPSQPGQEADIEVKWHMPATWLGKTDTEVAGVLSTWFEKHGHPELSSRYLKDLAAAFPDLNLNQPGTLTHTYVSVAWTPKTGLYMTMYYTPRITQFYK